MNSQKDNNAKTVLRNCDRANDNILPALACFIDSDSQAINKLDLPSLQIRMLVGMKPAVQAIPTSILLITPNG